MDDNPVSPLSRLLALVSGALRPPPGTRRIGWALAFGIVCYTLFTLAVLAMVIAMFFGMSKSLGQIPYPWHVVANLLLVLQFPLGHSLFLTRRGRRFLASLAPTPHADTLATTTYAIIASAQLFALFAFWTTSSIVW